MKSFTIIGGLNGVGKSSLLGILVEEKPDIGLVLNVDEMSAMTHVSTFTAGKMALQSINNCLNNGISFSQETTLSGRGILHTTKRAKELNYHVRLYYVGLNSLEECINRIKNRAEKGGHYITPSDVIRRYNSRFNVLVELLPYCDEVTFYDNDNGFRLIARCAAIKSLVDNPPEWILQLKQIINNRFSHIIQ